MQRTIEIQMLDADTELFLEMQVGSGMSLLCCMRGTRDPAATGG
jgi:hypothetical protein